jgi:hypothetical protein
MFDKNSSYHDLSNVVGISSRPESSIATTDFASMSVDELWKLREKVGAILARKTAAEITVLKRYLQRL